MTNLVNFARDMWWPSSVVLSATSDAAFSTSSMAVTADATVAQHVNSMSTDLFSSTDGFTTVKSAGCLLLGTVDFDNLPFRVQGGYGGPNIARWCYGFYDSGSVAGARVFHVGSDVDRIVAVPPLADSDPSYGNPICFFCSVHNGVVASGLFALSVQRCISSPPGFASAVS